MKTWNREQSIWENILRYCALKTWRAAIAQTIYEDFHRTTQPETWEGKRRPLSGNTPTPIFWEPPRNGSVNLMSYCYKSQEFWISSELDCEKRSINLAKPQRENPDFLCCHKLPTWTNALIFQQGKEREVRPLAYTNDRHYGSFKSTVLRRQRVGTLQVLSVLSHYGKVPGWFWPQAARETLLSWEEMLRALLEMSYGFALWVQIPAQPSTSCSTPAPPGHPCNGSGGRVAMPPHLTGWNAWRGENRAFHQYWQYALFLHLSMFPDTLQAPFLVSWYF